MWLKVISIFIDLFMRWMAKYWNRLIDKCTEGRTVAATQPPPNILQTFTRNQLLSDRCNFALTEFSPEKVFFSRIE